MWTGIGIEGLPSRRGAVLSNPELLPDRGKKPPPGLGEAADPEAAGQPRKAVGAKPICRQFRYAHPSDVRWKVGVIRTAEDAPCVSREGEIDASASVPVEAEGPDLRQETRRRFVLREDGARPFSRAIVAGKHGSSSRNIPA